MVLEDRDGRNAAAHANDLMMAHGGKILSVYDSILAGFAIETSGDMSQPVWGASGSAYQTPSLTSTTSYWVHAVGQTNAVSSNTATVTIGSCPSISIPTHPQSASILQGESLTLTVAASSVNPLTYRWYAGSTAIPDSNSPSITVAPTQQTNYRVVITNGCTTRYSNWAWAITWR